MGAGTIETDFLAGLNIYQTGMNGVITRDDYERSWSRSRYWSSLGRDKPNWLKLPILRH
jgi:hypothetical protein